MRISDIETFKCRRVVYSLRGVTNAPDGILGGLTGFGIDNLRRPNLLVTASKSSKRRTCSQSWASFSFYYHLVCLPPRPANTSVSFWKVSHAIVRDVFLQFDVRYYQVGNAMDGEALGRAVDEKIHEVLRQNRFSVGSWGRPLMCGLV